MFQSKRIFVCWVPILAVIIFMGLPANGQQSEGSAAHDASALELNPFDVRTQSETPVTSQLASRTRIAHRTKDTFSPSIAENNLKAETALDRLANADYYETRFDDVLEELKANFEIPIIIDSSSIENGLDGDTLITFSLRGCRASTLLDAMLRPHECTYAIHDGIVNIVSTDAADSERWLELRDIQSQELIERRFEGNGSELVAFVQEMVNPDSWIANGGAGRIQHVDGKLFISQNSITMRRVRHLLDRLARQN